MALVVGDVGTVIELDIFEEDSAGVETPTTFNVVNDKVFFVFQFSDGSKLSVEGEFLTGSKARYITQAGDLSVSGRTQLQLQITSTAWSGSTDPPLILTLANKF